jgi:hypothetical protein
MPPAPSPTLPPAASRSSAPSAAPLPESTSAAHALPALLLGAAGALVGAAIFAGLGIATDFQIGYVAVLVGFLTGLGVRVGARHQVPQALSTLAAALAIAGVAASKYMMFAYFATRDNSLSMLSGRVFSVFADHIGDMLSPFDVLWVILAAGAAMRASRGQRR